MKHGSKNQDLGYNVGGDKHGGTYKDGKFVTGHPADMSDYNGGMAEYGPDLKTFASGGAGGYPGSVHKGKTKV